MSIPRAIALAVALFATAGTITASPRGSTNYTVPTDIIDAGGAHASSASYGHNGSLGGVSGDSAGSGGLARGGFFSQLTEVTGLQVSAAPATVDEGATRQLNGAQLLDDFTTVALPAAAIAWSVQSGPLTGVDTGGLASADIVFADTSAAAQGVMGGYTGTVALTVRDTLPDNFGSYAGDGLGDNWQVQHFGLNSTNAGPLLDPDGDGQNNRFELVAGLSPTDAGSRFTLNIQTVPLQPSQMDVVFSPRFSNRTYVVRAGPSPDTNTFAALAAGAPSDLGTTRTVTDTNAGPRKYYHVQISEP